ncbi:hypothetical protein TcBrA4_0111330 [Trypanosoma cruzi]|nr:hypothetical protein TcBrA4_0111330 [Trypanosoma cruzi]
MPRPSATIGVPGLLARACAFVLWTDRRRSAALAGPTLICCSSFYEEVPQTRQVEVPEEVGRSCLFSVRGTAPPTQRVACIRRARAGLPRSGQEDVPSTLVGRQGVVVLTSGKETLRPLIHVACAGSSES